MIPNHKGEIPVALLLLPFVLGVFTGLSVFPGVNFNFLLGLFAATAVVFVIFNLKYNALKLYKQRWVGGGLIAILLFLFGWTLPVRHNELRSATHFSKFPAQYLVIRINNEPVLKNGLFRFTADVEETVLNEQEMAATGTLLVTIKDSLAKRLNYGDDLLIPAKYNAIDPPFNPAEFNYKSYLAHKNIFYQAFLYAKQYAVLRTGTDNGLVRHSIRLRQRLVEKLRQNIRDTGAYAVASALILGYRADLSADILEVYSKTGTVYVLTVSGAQVAVIYLVLAFALRYLDRYKHGKIIRVAVIIAVVWYYALLTGFSVSVCRAGLMLSFVLIGKASIRYVNTLNILAVSAFILLCYDPFFITEAGFQLSYLAVFGAIILRPVVYKWFRFKNKITDKIWSLCSFSIAIQLAIFPLCALYFHQFPVYFLLSNLLVIVPAAIVMYTGICFLLLPKVPLLSTALAFLLEKTTVLMNKMLAFIEHFPGASLDKIWLSTSEYLLLYVIVISLFLFWYLKRIRWLQFGLFCCLLLFISFSIKTILQSTTSSIAWLNLKKHPGIVFKNGQSAIVLTDLKESDKNYKYSIQPYLDSCRINDVKIYDLNCSVNTPWLKKKFGFIKFTNTSVFIYDGNLGTDALSPGLKIDFIYVTGNPELDTNTLEANFDFRALIIDGSNSDKRIANWEKQLYAKSINYKILKRNKSFISISN